MRAMNPQNEWGWMEVLTNKTNHLLDVLIWSKTKDALRDNPINYPTPFIPPFMEEKSKKESEQVAMPIEDLEAYLTRPRV